MAQFSLSCEEKLSFDFGDGRGTVDFQAIPLSSVTEQIQVPIEICSSIHFASFLETPQERILPMQDSNFYNLLTGESKQFTSETPLVVMSSYNSSTEQLQELLPRTSDPGRLDVNMEPNLKLLNAPDPGRGKRKTFLSDSSDIEEDDLKFPKVDLEETKKQNHSEIEKRRRDKMNTYIMELSAMVPMCNAMARKLDKLTVLRMAVQHMKTLRGSIHSYTEGHYKPSFLSDEEVKRLILEAAEGFLFVVGCDRGRILYVSESVSQILNYSQGDLLGQSWFDILHPKDIAKVKEQLSSPDLSPRERLIDAKTMLPVKTDVPQNQTRLCPGARRSFFCRMKCKLAAPLKEEADTTTGCHRRKKSQSTDRKYCVIHCTGYLKSWAPTKMGLEEDSEAEGESCNLSCLVAIGRTQPILQPSNSQNMHIRVQPTEYVSRHAIDGKFIYVDQRATLLLGYLPQELLGTSCYEYYHQDDIQLLADIHKAVLKSTDQVVTQLYRFRTKEGNFIRLQTKWKGFRNPWTKEVEYIVAVNTAIPSDTGVVESSFIGPETVHVSDSSLDAFFSTLPSVNIPTSNGSLQKTGGTRMGAGKIGRQIADEVLDTQRNEEPGCSSAATATVEDTISEAPQDGSNLSTYIPNNYSKDQHKVNSMIMAGNSLPTTAGTSSTTNNHSLLVNNLRPHQSNGNSNQYGNGIRRNNQVNNIILEPGLPNGIVAQSDPQIMDSLVTSEALQASSSQGSEGNDEAAMAVIMSLLEADAGLGGPVDFSGLPWPLP